MVSIEGVKFQYDAAGPVLSFPDFSCAQGDRMLLLGNSGAGKTTLTNLIARFYDASSGTICLDGRDLRDFKLNSYRSLLGIVEQDVFLFDGTIRENIAYAKRNVSTMQVVEAAKAAAADQFINQLPDGYDSIIGERGVKLSGGQRQRIAIARAILADPRILILDEATSNLDSESERLIQNSLSELLQNRTAFVIAHRLSTIAGADKIVVLEEGRIIEIGSHQQLLESGGRYRDMAMLQMNNNQPDAKNI